MVCWTKPPSGISSASTGVFPTSSRPSPPALLHGDLWTGNFLCDAAGRPVLIDPAMTTLFGGFEKPFYEAYDYHYPLPPGYREQWNICNLYPLLVHLNLFEHAYMGNILDTIQRF